jgi:hypothetical protein
MVKKFNISVRFHETGAVSIDHIRYGPSTEIARFFADWRVRWRKDRDREIVEKHCPDCKTELETIGLNSCGTVYRCSNCQTEWIIRKRLDGYNEFLYETSRKCGDKKD